MKEFKLFGKTITLDAQHFIGAEILYLLPTIMIQWGPYFEIDIKFIFWYALIHIAKE